MLAETKVRVVEQKVLSLFFRFLYCFFEATLVQGGSDGIKKLLTTTIVVMCKQTPSNRIKKVKKRKSLEDLYEPVC